MSESEGEEGVAILYICSRCDAENWRRSPLIFGQFINDVECEECGHIIREAGEQ